MNNLTIHLEAGTGTAMYEQLYEYLRNEIIDGKISQREKLPSTRFLATNLGVSRNTVDRAYQQLLAEGYIEAKPCSGYRVCDVTSLYLMKKEVDEERVKECSQVKEAFSGIDFTKGGIDLETFPLATWRKISRRVLQEDVSILETCNPLGEYKFRCVIADYLYRARGVVCTPEQIIVGAGNDYLLMLLTGILQGNHKVAMEKSSYEQARHILKQGGCEIVEVEADENGLQADELKQTDANLVYVMPSHQYPLGVVMPLTRRLELLEWAKEQNAYIIEDDYDSEFRYKGKPIPALQGYDKDGRVIYLGTFSKSIAPAIRVSYMVLPVELMDSYQKNGGMVSATVSKIQQETIRLFIKDGYFERHLNKMRNRYKEKRDCLLECIGDLRADWNIRGEDAGIHLLLEYPAVYGERLEVELRKAKIKIQRVGVKENYEALILNYGHLRKDELVQSGTILKKIINQL